ncbi:ABC transporter permease [Pseudobacteriovorax antillogorgiicola]|uniref:Putative ABC transport system permease protein n=1 Tax=Pseudobacteriovorax antillogorgiicola TaxID=1513793 RepID=A0A1Y6BXA9_9BACT|nr:FtsX-like permease family protein [Pseudobacteriovorax antillogorgiicola]TCS50324.1 putative ABC transport system permease protein [Pseudobacteriovorax antillogorgiicola]SMF34482.1 putative ABC transport system permease protein [Pseudobacteriovorax antillogorgiicola]
MSFRIAWTELVHNKKFSLLFLINLMVGLLGFVTLDGFKNSFQEQLQNASKRLLTADLSVAARRPLTEAEQTMVRNTVGDSAQISPVTTLYSMAASSSRTSLVELKAISPMHPFYGYIELESGERIEHQSPLTSELNREAKIWVAPEITLQFKVSPGDTIKLGEQSFTIAGVIKDDSGMSWAGAAYAPRIYMGQDQLEATELLIRGSTAWHTLHIKMPEGADIEGIEKALFAILDNSVRVQSYFKAGQDNGRLLRYLTDYLGLVSLVALFLSGLGTFYLFRSYLSAKQRDIAILLSLGMQGTRATSIYLIQLLMLGLASALVSILISVLLLPQVTQILSSFSPIEIALSIGYETMVSAILIGTLTPLLLCLPLLIEIGNIKPSALFQEFYNPKLRISRGRLLGFLPAAGGTFGLSVWQSNSFLVGSLFFGSLVASTALISVLGFALLKLFTAMNPKSLSSRLALGYLNGQRVSALSCFLALSLSALLTNLIPQLENTLLKELERPEGEQLPSLFVFDIQEEQEPGLRQLLADAGIEINFLSPMIQARLKEINDEPFDKGEVEDKFSREAQREQRFRNRGVNLSYKPELSYSETIIEGEDFSGPYNFDEGKPGELSIEMRYAERLGLEIGDKMTFEIQGLPIEGVVKNLRKVKWNSFQPNFFIQFQPGVIDDAPKTFLAALPPMPLERKNELQGQIVEAYPNISMIDVSKLVKKLGEIIGQMSQVLRIMAWLSVLAGLIVTFSIANHQTRQRLWDINLLKILGSPFRTIQGMVLKEFFLLSFWAGGIGMISGLLASWLITKFVFDGLWSPNWETPIASLIWIVGLCLGVSWLASTQVLRKKPRLYL